MNLKDKYRLALGSVLIDGYAFLSKDNTTPQEGYILEVDDTKIKHNMPLFGEPQIGEKLFNTKSFVKLCQLSIKDIKNNLGYKGGTVGVLLYMTGSDDAAPLIHFNLFRHFNNEAEIIKFAREINNNEYLDLRTKKWMTF